VCYNYPDNYKGEKGVASQITCFDGHHCPNVPRCSFCDRLMRLLIRFDRPARATSTAWQTGITWRSSQRKPTGHSPARAICWMRSRSHLKKANTRRMGPHKQGAEHCTLSFHEVVKRKRAGRSTVRVMRHFSPIRGFTHRSYFSRRVNTAVFGRSDFVRNVYPVQSDNTY
jgi:hypothetical protein